MDTSLYIGPESAPDRYRLLRSIGRGGEAVLYLAEIQLGGAAEPVVVKVLDTQETMRPQEFAKISARWSEQAELLRFVHRLGVVGIREHFEGLPPHRAGEAGNPPGRALCLVMNHVEGLDLRDWRAEHTLETVTERREALRYLEQLAEVLDWLHLGKGTPSGRVVVHGDLSPGNVMIDAHGQATLVDFGLSKLTAEHRTAEVWFTPGFAAPEVFEGRRTPATDRYAFGAIAYFLLAGESPASTPEQVRGQFRALPALTALDEESREEVLAVFAADPAARPDSLSSWVKRLRQAVFTTTSSTSRAADAAGAAAGAAVAGQAAAPARPDAPPPPNAAPAPARPTAPPTPSHAPAPQDAGPQDAGPVDAGPQDAAPVDAAPQDAGRPATPPAMPTPQAGQPVPPAGQPVPTSAPGPQPDHPTFALGAAGGPPAPAHVATQAASPYATGTGYGYPGAPGGQQPNPYATAPTPVPGPAGHGAHPPAPAKKKSRRALLVTSVVLAVALLAGAGTFAATTYLGDDKENAAASQDGEDTTSDGEDATEETAPEETDGAEDVPADVAPTPSGPEEDTEAESPDPAASSEPPVVPEDQDEIPLTLLQPIEENGGFEQATATLDTTFYADALLTRHSCGSVTEYDLQRGWRKLTFVAGVTDTSTAGKQLQLTISNAEGKQLATRALTLGRPQEMSVDVTDVLRVRIDMEPSGCDNNLVGVLAEPTLEK
ncbi:protein kinase domain-containing protein [Streptomyces sp. GSL17-111]|uniref:protein kinase domain-containing protein n=1 Tax=Streptomyces sp. GSL17-111 TaxID=3121596 RepID=UPI0030F4B30E